MKLAIGYLSSEVTTVMINKIKRFNFIIIIYYLNITPNFKTAVLSLQNIIAEKLINRSLRTLLLYSYSSLDMTEERSLQYPQLKLIPPFSPLLPANPKVVHHSAQ